MKRYYLSIVILLMRIAGGLAMAYVFGVLLWLIGVVFYDTHIKIFNLWVGVIAALFYFLLFRLKRYLE